METASSDNFMWLPGQNDVVGETTDSQFSQRDAFEVMSFSFNMTCSESTDGSGGVGANAGKAKFNTVTIEKVVDSASAALYKACSQGAIFPSIMMGIRKAGGDPILYLQYIFRYNQVTGISWAGGSGTERVKETLTISFKAMGMQYVQMTSAGKPMPGKSWYWNTVNQGVATLDITGIPGAPKFLPPLGVFK
jgi:type VI secretion system secreted protein Hcp